MLSIVATLIIVTFLFLRSSFKSNKRGNFEFNADVNIININILNSKRKNINKIVDQLKPYFKYFKLKSANIENQKSSYIFWYDIEPKKIKNFLVLVNKLSDENLEISIYSKTGAYE